ncbi:MAG: hypothetical protein K9K79_10100 [Desulfohalobiaceae bacterium]|nr:hypothetical protein [Desulfohalobiaceae bacterium]
MMSTKQASVNGPYRAFVNLRSLKTISMIGKKIQFFVIVTAILLAAFSSWYVYRQSRELTAINQNKSEIYSQDIRTGQDQPKRPSVSENATDTLPAENGTEVRGKIGADEDQHKENRAARMVSAIQDMFLTSFVVNDLAGYLADQYHPAGSRDNPGSSGTLEVSFKSLNARYGLELVGVKHSDMPLQKAREEVLALLMDPEVLRHAYELAAEDFVRTLTTEAEQSEKVFLDDRGAKKRAALNPEQVREMLRLCSGYLRELSRVFEILAWERSIASRIGAYLQAENRVEQSNYAFQQMKYDLEKLEGNGQADQTAHRIKLQKARSRKEAAADELRRAIQKRERIRQDLIAGIREAGEAVSLNSHEILYISKWVHRRLQGEGRAVGIRVAADLLEDMSGRLARQAEAYSSSKR